MGISCGCGEPNERHGDDRHITREDLEQAAQAANTSVAGGTRNIAASSQLPMTGNSDSA